MFVTRDDHASPSLAEIKPDDPDDPYEEHGNTFTPPFNALLQANPVCDQCSGCCVHVMYGTDCDKCPNALCNVNDLRLIV